MCVRVCTCGVLLGNFDFDMDIVVSEAIATDTCNSLPRETDSLVCLDACRDLGPTPIPYYCLVPIKSSRTEVHSKKTL